MKLNNSTGAIAFLLATPLVSGLTVGIAPSSAAIIAGSTALVRIENFSHRPKGNGTFTNTYTQTTANNGLVISEAIAEAVFVSNGDGLLTANHSETIVQGDGNNYSGLAKTQAIVLGDFDIDAAETFSFHFQTVLDLLTSVDNRESERARARSSISFSLINTVTNILFDSFEIVSGLGSSSGHYFNFSPSNSFNPTAVNFNLMAEGSEAESLLYTSGVYSRKFDSATSLRLVEVNNNIAEAEAVPEPSTLLGTAIFLGLFVKKRKLNDKLSQVKSKV
ncbi:PEP-CTERM sorting domain-containing protein [Microcoleus sp. herbarium2]|uniref:PEP-CTERM sorting domain-containing protein n=1 Tax=Microcoleus sp. herbarium2 TaxID=3055433 RepID=UPI002FD4CFA7